MIIITLAKVMSRLRATIKSVIVARSANMKLHPGKEKALLDWINYINEDVRLKSIKELHDGVVLMKIVYKLRNEEPPKTCLDQPIHERLKVVSDFLQVNRCRMEQGTIISWDNITNGVNLGAELSKVVLFLLHYNLTINNHVDLSRLDYKCQNEVVSMLRFVLEYNNGFYLSEDWEKYIKMAPLFSADSDINSSHTSSSSTFSLDNAFSDNESPILHRKKGTHSVRFLDLSTVASSSICSPLQEVMNTPQFQLKKLQRQLRQERDLRDELEKDLATNTSALEHRENQVCQLQFTIEKLQREKAEQEQEPRDELRELLSQNEGLRSRLHEVLKQCQELKTNSSQMERKVDDLTEENGTLSCQMRELIARLARAEAEVARLTDAQDLAMAEWSHRNSTLQADLSQATAQRECLTEQMLILHSKISSLEDELHKAQTQERGEVMGPIMECEQLKEYECTIARLEEEKEQAAALVQTLAQEKKQDVDELREQLRLLKEQLQDIQESNKKISAKLEEKEESISQKKERIRELEKELQIVSRRQQETLVLVDSLQEEIEKRSIAETVASEKAREQESRGVQLEFTVSVLQKDLELAFQHSAAKSQHCDRLEEMLEQRGAQLEDLRQQEEVTMEEVARLRQEVSTHIHNLEEVQREKESLKEELAQQQEELRGEVSLYQERAAELQQRLGEQEAAVRVLKQQDASAKEEAALKMQAIQAQMRESASHAAAKDLQICTLREEATALRDKLAKRELEISHQQEVLEVANREKESVVALREELSAKLTIQQEKAAVLQKSLEEEKEALRTVTGNEVSAREEATRLRQEISSYVSRIEKVQKEKEELKEQEEGARGEAIMKMEAIKAQMIEVSSQSAAKDLQICTLTEEATALQDRLAKRELEISHQQELLEVANREKESVEALREELVLKHKELRVELTIQQEKAAVLQKSLEEEQEALRTVTGNEVSAREEATRLRQEISSYVSRIEKVQKEKEELKEQEEGARGEAIMKMEAIKAQMIEVSSQSAAKDLQICTLTEKATALQDRLAKRELEISHQQELLEVANREKESVEALREELVLKHKELRVELTIQQEKAAELQKSLEEEQEALRTKTGKEVSVREDATLKIEALKAQMVEVSSQSAAKDLQICTLREEATALRDQLAKRELEISHHQELLEVANREKESVEALQEELRLKLTIQQEKAAELQKSLEEEQEALRTVTGKEVNAREEATLKIEAITAQMVEVSSQASAKDQQICTLREEATALRDQLAKRELEISHQQELLEVANREKESVEALREELVLKHKELRVELTIQQEKAAELQKSLEEEQEALRTKTGKEVSVREDATLKIEALKAQMVEVSSQSAAKDLQICTLREEATALRDQLSKRELEISHHQELLGVANREKESVEALREELVLKHKELRVELTIQQEKAAELQKSLEEEQEALRTVTGKEVNAREEATLKIEAITAQMVEVSSQASAKDQQICTLREEATALRDQLAKRELEISHQLELLEVANREKDSVEALQEELVLKHKELRVELTIQQEKAAELQKSLEEEQEALRTKTGKEVSAREEATRLRQEISTNVSHLEKVQKEKEELKEQEEGAREETILKMEAIKAQMFELSSQSAAKDLQICTMREEATALLDKLAKRELEISHQQEVLEVANREKESVVALREELVRQKEALMEELSILQKEKGDLLCRALEVEQIQRDLNALLLEKQQLTESNRSLERKCNTNQRLEALLQEEQALTQKCMDGAKELESQKKELQEQLAASSEAVEHYKAQVEKVKTHYLAKKQQLVEFQEKVTELQRIVEVKEHDLTAVTVEMKKLQKELEKARSTEKQLNSIVNTLKAQLAFADRHLRGHSKVKHERGPKRVEKVTPCHEPQETSTDSLDLDDSLDTTTRPSLPDDSSTPLLRSSERLAAKRHVLGQDCSLETLYFTPMNTRQTKRTSMDLRLENSINSLGELALDSAVRRPPSSSAKRRRTTQVINITMSKKTPGREGGGDNDNETFYSIASARSHPNLTGTYPARPSSMEVPEMPGKLSSTSSDQLLNLPGYRRSAVHAAPPRSTSQFCVGTENEPEQAGDDWMRIAELQARNKACLPHLKSSYPLESRPSLGPSFVFTEDDLRTGDPSETMRRASMMPGEIQDSLLSHRVSLHLGHADSTVASGPAYASHRLSLMPPKASSTLSHQNSHNLRSSTLPLKRSAKEEQPVTPEAKRALTSCFPRPLTPKRGRFGVSNVQNPLSKTPVDRRQSMAFCIDNTPQKGASKSGFLQRRVDKIRKSTRKSPGSSAAKSPRNVAVRSPQPGGKGQKKPPKTPSSARKMMSFRMKM
ncbi:hypothetical protein UPYG_G00204450 [Umbra pygmaea]|uniref:Nuclear mitotic apparatus protein 1 N-terminal hook domain-containing protein n=1 Tax=Umbra pygmaea TaxID=75934 RepID=A0ABD0X0Y7_UMBPY